LIVSIFGLIYVALIGLFLFFAHLAFVTHIRGSAVRLGPEQFPELHRRVEELAARAGIGKMPEAYLMQAGGTLNALATKFLGTQMIVLYSDLLEACGDDESARDMIIGHELGHIKAGHLRWIWLLIPGLIVPFLGAAYSRAREFTCDRYGAALCGKRKGALLGLSILAAGARHAPGMNLQAFVSQRRQLDTGWMTLGQWLSNYPPLCERVASVDPALNFGVPVSARGPIRAVVLLAGLVSLPVLATVPFVLWVGPLFEEAIEEAAAAQEGSRGSLVLTPTQADAAEALVQQDLADLTTIVMEFHQSAGKLPADGETVYSLWRSLRRGERVPTDPFDGMDYGYVAAEDGFILFSSGPDGEPQTDDDITKMSSVTSGAGPE